MFNRLTVATNGSETTWRAIAIADGLATRCDAELEILQIVAHGGHVRGAQRELQDQLADHTAGIDSAPHHRQDRVSNGAGPRSPNTPGANPRGIVVMDSFGRGRTGAVLGSVTMDVLRATGGPLMVVGPHALVREAYRGDVVVPVDGSLFRGCARAGCRVGGGARDPSVGGHGPRPRPPREPERRLREQLSGALGAGRLDVGRARCGVRGAPRPSTRSSRGEVRYRDRRFSHRREQPWSDRNGPYGRRKLRLGTGPSRPLPRGADPTSATRGAPPLALGAEVRW